MEVVDVPIFNPKSVLACTLTARFPSTLPMTSTAWLRARWESCGYTLTVVLWHNILAPSKRLFECLKVQFFATYTAPWSMRRKVTVTLPYLWKRADNIVIWCCQLRLNSTAHISENRFSPVCSSLQCTGDDGSVRSGLDRDTCMEARIEARGDRNLPDSVSNPHSRRHQSPPSRRAVARPFRGCARCDVGSWRGAGRGCAGFGGDPL
jgi:hypothetical protein